MISDFRLKITNITAIGFIALVFMALFSMFMFRAVSAATVSPLTFDVTVDPGQVVSNYITIFNTEGTPIGFNVEAEDFTAVGESGGVALSDSVSPELSAKNWLTFSPNSFVVEPGKSATIQFTLQVPLDADPGGKYTSVVFSSTPGVGGGGPAIAQKIASLLLIKVTGVVQESLAVRSFESPEFLENGPVSFVLRLENRGTVHLKPAGYVFFQDWRGNEVEKLALGIYGSANEPLSASVSFWVIPWKIVGLASLVLLLLFGFLFKAKGRVGMAFKVLFRGE
ncbi:MAG: hypothetical protein HYT12_04295 [Candidatus Liptonbacteria bacterium]|nr:hypothetical protein [Candidatus Liptonbacteria bacterium]